MSERAGTEAGYEEAGRSKEREARERRTDIALYSQDTERQTQKTRTKTQLASFLRHSTLSLSHTRYSDSPLPLQKRAIPRRAARSTTNSTSRHILLCVCVLSPHLLLSHPIQPCLFDTRIQKKAYARTRRHRDPPSSSCARGHKQGERRGTPSAVQQGLAKAAVPAPRPTLHPLLPRAFPLSARASDAVRSRPRRLRGALVAPIRVEALLEPKGPRRVRALAVEHLAAERRLECILVG